MAKIKDLDELEQENKENKFISSADMSKGTIKKNKGGRPKKEPHKKATQQVFVNLTTDEKKEVEAYAEKYGLSLSNLFKNSVFEKYRK